MITGIRRRSGRAEMAVIISAPPTTGIVIAGEGVVQARPP
jgi:hypothetical protein